MLGAAHPKELSFIATYFWHTNSPVRLPTLMLLCAASEYKTGAQATTTATATSTAKKPIGFGLLSKTTTLHVHLNHAFFFVHFLVKLLHDSDVKLPHFTESYKGK